MTNILTRIIEVKITRTKKSKSLLNWDDNLISQRKNF